MTKFLFWGELYPLNMPVVSKCFLRPPCSLQDRNAHKGSTCSCKSVKALCPFSDQCFIIKNCRLNGNSNQTHIYKPQSILIIPIGRLNRKVQEHVKGHRKRQEFDLQTKGLFLDTTNDFRFI